MNSVDIAIGVFLLIGFLAGLRKGFIIQIASLLAIVLGIYCAAEFSDVLADYLRANHDITSEYLPTFSFVLIMIAVLIVVQIIAKTIEKVFNLIALGGLNKLSGGVFSLVKFAFICSVLIYIGERFSFLAEGEEPEKYQTSKLYEPVKQLAPFFVPALTDFYQENFGEESENEEVISLLSP
jgi:membrane protein required for colicin V production